ncbi:hypothetical protein BX616_002769 [Lobosporangium transversale]|uniref:F-box domain-containing protein n=1 Tax=Lobosporangium transversale TaxID=64571 RepID=A0A1Y2GE86_9FUNG|nr:hypothetical protein BCR41DRAFT_163500 [Lobosporangium transversale]KAF9916809.1 hypothetical protein BX616_002769 [Lobosporangium transversale]ORZ06984.1 hypothetical protein BCR41DRAFT_163500 [Lobosporangium transversale]|eukprot:XP_021877780.1 hypothetical protein BCR41DRAFT_163500 [Lobosporangium transversale]
MSNSGQNEIPQPIHPLLLPEILVLIGPHLSQATVLQCVLVCSIWNVYLTPFLFQRVNLPKRKQLSLSGSGKRASRPMISALQRNGSNIQTLICADNNTILRQIIPYCNAIETLVLAKITTEVVSILRHCKETLTQLEFTPAARPSASLPLPTSSSSPASLSPLSSAPLHFRTSSFSSTIPRLLWTESNEILEAILQLSKLKHLVLSFLGLRTAEQLTPFFQFCQQHLESLELHNTAVFGCSPKPMEFNKLRSLCLVESTMSYQAQALLVVQCPYLKHITWISSQFVIPMSIIGGIRRGDNQEDQYSQSGHDDRRANLKSLEISNGIALDEDIACALERLPSLETILVRESLFGSLCLQIVLKYLQNQIQVIDVADCKAVTPEMVCMMMLSCPALKSLTADRIRAMDVIELSPTSSPAPAVWLSSPLPTSPSLQQRRQEWVCHGLEELRVVFVGPSLLTPYETQHAIYNQIAKLRNLRLLSLGRNASTSSYSVKSVLDLTLTNGLTQLAPLRELQEFDFCQMYHKMGMDEYKFMLKNWPKLEVMHGYLHTDSDRAAFVESFLQNERPGIRLKHNLKYKRTLTRTVC